MVPYEPENTPGMYPKRKLIVVPSAGLKVKTLDNPTDSMYHTYID
jgi:hypothetical protein